MNKQTQQLGDRLKEMLDRLRDSYTGTCQYLMFANKMMVMIMVIVVVENQTEAPQLKSDCDGGKVASSHVVQLSCATADALIYYTTDGMAPHLHSDKIKVFYLT